MRAFVEDPNHSVDILCAQHEIETRELNQRYADVLHSQLIAVGFEPALDIIQKRVYTDEVICNVCIGDTRVHVCWFPNEGYNIHAYYLGRCHSKASSLKRLFELVVRRLKREGKL